MTRVAIVHDYLTQRGGAERVVLAMARTFPGAPIHTSLYEPSATFPEFSEMDVRPLALNRLGTLRIDHRRALPLLAPAFSRLQIDADVVLCSSSGWAHGVQTSGAKVVYCHNPARWLYQPDDYARAGTAARFMASTAGRALRRWDRRAALTADRYIANSSVVQSRIRAAYGLDAEILPPPFGIATSGAQTPVSGCRPGAFLCVSRLLPYKHVDSVISAFARDPERQLVVVGTGPDEGRLRRLAPPNVVLVGRIEDAELRWLYANCTALVSASHEDFGLTPLEAASFGKPAAVLSSGGFLDTVVEGRTGTFFDRPHPDDIREGIARLEDTPWDVRTLTHHAEGYSVSRFGARLKEIVREAGLMKRPTYDAAGHGTRGGPATAVGRAPSQREGPADLSVSVVIPTRNRPDRLARCLASLSEARRFCVFSIVVCDSSDEAFRAEVETVVASAAAELHFHDGRNVAAARNACVRAATGDLLINVDDDVYVEAGAIRALVSAFEKGQGPRVMAGSVRWGDDWSRPVVMRRIGWGRWAEAGEDPSFLVGAFFAYPRVLGEAWPWNERIRVSDDRFMGALWRGKGVSLEFEPTARAIHDDRHVAYGVQDQESHVYTNMFDTLVANRDLSRAALYQVLGFAAGAKGFGRTPAGMRDLVRAWAKGNARFIRDLRFLRELAARPLPPDAWRSPALVNRSRPLPGPAEGSGDAGLRGSSD